VVLVGVVPGLTPAGPFAAGVIAGSFAAGTVTRRVFAAGAVTRGLLSAGTVARRVLSTGAVAPGVVTVGAMADRLCTVGISAARLLLTGLVRCGAAPPVAHLTVRRVGRSAGAVTTRGAGSMPVSSAILVTEAERGADKTTE
jgi:hypothetical protein